MATVAVMDFFSDVRANPAAVAKLSGCANSDEFVDRAVRLGSELGYSMVRDDIVFALRSARPSRQENASALSDQELDSVQGGGGGGSGGAFWEALITPGPDLPK